MNKIERHYKIITVIVNIISVLCLIVGGLMYYTKEGYDENMFQMAKDCHKKENIGDCIGTACAETCVNWVYDEWEERNALMYWLLGISLGLPILFYGGRETIDYLFPTKKTE